MATLSNLSWLGCRDAKRRSLESQALSLTESHQSHTLCLRPTLFHTVNFYHLWFVLITLGAVSQFLFTAGKLKLKSVSRFLFLEISISF